MDCYVYYKSVQENEWQIVQQVRILQQYLSEQMKIELQLQRRPSVDNGIITWMEVYRGIPPAFLMALSTAENQTQLISLIQGERHVEYFEDAISCA